MTNPTPPLTDLNLSNDKNLICLIQQLTYAMRTITPAHLDKLKYEIVNGNRDSIPEMMQILEKRITAINEDFNDLKKSINKYL